MVGLKAGRDEDLPLPTGVFWAGYVSDRGGYGTVSRNYLKMLEVLNIPVHIHNLGQIHKEIAQDDRDLIGSIHRPISDLGTDPVMVIHSTPDDFARFNTTGFNKKIGITIFETDKIPDYWVSLCNQMDEIWVPTAFNYHTFTESGVDETKVRVMPYGIDVQKYDKNFEPYSFSTTPKTFTFLYTCQFDYRKGFDLLINSFCEEFTDNDDVTLIIKTYVHENDIDAEAIIRSYIPIKNNIPSILIINEKMPENELLSLYSSCTCYISTDRACGWGMPQMEMMAMGKPVISINWSGSTEFMNDENTFLIQPLDELEPVDINLMINRPLLYMGHKWAKVSVENVRKTMRDAYRNKEKRLKIAKNAKEMIDHKYSINEIAKVMKQNLAL
ncbi:glycosyl transferase family 1 [Bacillus canaveralius]|uniref:Glycosyl transferase family 1 n=1 Tax=Bacillus canaveralius TaxID=1403243 RepID=A0A2N5GIJ6_9BACI|nr:glycosyltransferase [Bacillus canaveralius]PLR80750.1 glycosyl transferase family 1 [Bacillus canaveralius]PLR98372.1 glycosyl transferase family 1 [Bacillus canaveralius]